MSSVVAHRSAHKYTSLRAAWVPTVRAVPGVLRRDGRQHSVDHRVADDRARSRRQYDRPAVGHGRLLAHLRKPAADGWIGRRPPRPAPRPAGGAGAVRPAQSARHRRQLHGAADRAPRGTRRGCRDDGPDHQFARLPPVRRRHPAHAGDNGDDRRRYERLRPRPADRRHRTRSCPVGVVARGQRSDRADRLHRRASRCGRRRSRA